MPVLDNPKHELFAQELAKGRTQVEAYAKAGYDADDGNACRLAEKVSHRVQEITGRGAERAGVTVQSLIEEAEAARIGAMAEGQFAAAISAIREKGVLSGKRIERSERGAPGDFDNMSTEDIVSELRDMGVDVNIH